MSGHQDITCERAQALIAAESVTILDLRDHRSYRAGHIEGALLLHDGLMQTLVKLDQRHKPILIYCYRGATSKPSSSSSSASNVSTVWRVVSPSGPSSSARRKAKQLDRDVCFADPRLTCQA